MAQAAPARRRSSCAFFLRLAFKLRGSYAKVWPLFTSDLIAVIRKSTSSDSQWVCAGWLERFDWMWNKQGLPQSTAKAIKWSLRGRPSSLWWLCDGHESAFCFWFSFSFPSASTALVYLPVSFSMHLSVCPWLLIRLFWNQLDSSFYLCFFFYYLYIRPWFTFCEPSYLFMPVFQPFSPSLSVQSRLQLPTIFWWVIVLVRQCHK